MHRNLIFALHGFLGTSTDWNKTQEEFLKHEDKEVTWLAPDLFHLDSPSIRNFDSYVEELIKSYQRNLIVTGKKIFLGYSLGGRVGLHILKHFPDFFDQFIFLSAHPGLRSRAEKEERLVNDLRWAGLAGELPWNEFMKAWNGQAVFAQGKTEPQRLITDYDLNKIADALNLWSLGNQDDLRPVIQENQSKVTWVVGEDDFKFCSLADDMYNEKILLGYNRISSGHRILFDNPTALANLLHQYL